MTKDRQTERQTKQLHKTLPILYMNTHELYIIFRLIEVPLKYQRFYSGAGE